MYWAYSADNYVVQWSDRKGLKWSILVSTIDVKFQIDHYSLVIGLSEQCTSKC